jgi:hypothetical protein
MRTLETAPMKRIARTAAPVIVALALVLGGSSAALASSKSPTPVVNPHGNGNTLPVVPGPVYTS